MLKRADRNVLRLQRHARLRKAMAGTPERPRLSVFRSLKHMYAQIVDDSRGVTLAAASTLDPELRPQVKGNKKVVFDRGGYKYHGRIKALADAARKAGLEF